MKRILLVEDDLSLIYGLVFALEKQGYGVTNSRTKADAIETFHSGDYDLVILDVTLPDGTGYEICKEIRTNSTVPILFLTAAYDETDITMGLDLGGDDYITKPFKLAILFSRINALIRRSEQYSERKSDEIYSNGIRIDLNRSEVYKDDEKIDLSVGEYKLLRLFMENKGRVLSSEQILSDLWDCEEKFVDSNTLTVYIRRLRLKIENDPGNPSRILTVRGFGYKWNE